MGPVRTDGHYGQYDANDADSDTDVPAEFVAVVVSVSGVYLDFRHVPFRLRLCWRRAILRAGPAG